VSRTEVLDELEKSGSILDRNQHEILKFKNKKTEFRLLELDRK
jgi:hypothetical protein